MNANVVLAICATAIAIASLGVSVYAAWATREHNRLSVTAAVVRCDHGAVSA
jgi:hypothetical protein